MEVLDDEREPRFALERGCDIADSARDVDFAMRWGYGWSMGPFESWQAAGWKQVAEWVKGAPLSERALLVAQQIGIAALLVLMSFVFYNDITRLLGS